MCGSDAKGDERARRRAGLKDSDFHWEGRERGQGERNLSPRLGLRDNGSRVREHAKLANQSGNCNNHGI